MLAGALAPMYSVPWSPWFSAKLVVVPQQTYQQLCQCTEAAASRCAGSYGCPLLRWLCGVHLNRYPPRHLCDAKGSESSSDTGKKLTSVSFPWNNGGLPRPLRSLSSSVSSISSGFKIDRDRNTSISSSRDNIKEKILRLVLTARWLTPSWCDTSPQASACCELFPLAPVCSRLELFFGLVTVS